MIAGCVSSLSLVYYWKSSHCIAYQTSSRLQSVSARPVGLQELRGLSRVAAAKMKKSSRLWWLDHQPASSQQQQKHAQWDKLTARNSHMKYHIFPYSFPTLNSFLP